MAGVPSSVVFHKFGSSSRPFTTSVAGTVHQYFYTRSRATSGTSYGARFQHYIAGAAGAGAALRVYGLIKGVAGSVLGIEATGELNSATGSSVTASTGCVAAGRFVCSIQIDPSTTGRAACLILDTDVKTSLSPLTMESNAYIHVRKSGAGTNIGNLFYFENVAGAASDTTVTTTVHDTSAPTTAIRAIKCDFAGTDGWVYVFSDTPSGS
ncbi:MAG: hypothetical protein M0R22_13660 [Dehalococcoidia bacterium]|jgi:hypothetical protein|nr:hypothetical protein [Dehalococcoidia bacterium]